jgi:predicted AAA+ superfamily ATPase
MSQINLNSKIYERDIVNTLVSRLNEPRKFIQIITGPRQTGKTTAIRQALAKVDLPQRYVSANTAATHVGDWLKLEWQQARNLITPTNPSAILVIDEVQNVEQWSSVVKSLWDDDAWSGIDLRVILSGSSSLLIQKGLSESLMGRFETLYSTHWSYPEMHDAFGYDFDDFLWYGGYPAGAFLKDDFDRWSSYVNDAIIEATLSKDIFQMEEIRKPALMRKLFILGCQYSAQEVSYRKIQGQLDDSGNSATIAHYLNLLESAGLLCGIHKFNPNNLTSRKSSPRFMVFDTSLMSVTSGKTKDYLNNPDVRGHYVESAVGTYLLSRSKTDKFAINWWRESDHEVDFVVEKGAQVKALEVKSGRIKNTKGLIAITNKYPEIRPIIVGDSNTPVEVFISNDIPMFG